jgi:hypothetical protein
VEVAVRVATIYRTEVDTPFLEHTFHIFVQLELLRLALNIDFIPTVALAVNVLLTQCMLVPTNCVPITAA